MPTTTGLRWHDADWQREAQEWIRAEANRQSIQLTGDIEQPHVYAWSTVMRVLSSEDTLFFKATAPETVYEAALTQKLVDWYPDYMPELLAVDLPRGWMLMRDGGQQLRALIRPTQDVKPWDPILNRYAELQIRMADHISEILALGIPDQRLAVLPELFSQFLAKKDQLMIDQEKGLTSAEFLQLQSLTSRFEQICRELTSLEIPESLNHGDFHDGNVLLKDKRITFFDWGDASVTHPFVSLRTLFVSIEIALQLDDYSFTPEMAALLDRYLEPWQKFTSKENLLTAYQLSKPVASIVKALAWNQTISRLPLDSPLRAEYRWILPELMREFFYHEKNLSDS